MRTSVAKQPGATPPCQLAATVGSVPVEPAAPVQVYDEVSNTRCSIGSITKRGFANRRAGFMGVLLGEGVGKECSYFCKKGTVLAS